MSFVTELSARLLQATTFPDTIVARTLPERGLLEWTGGVLQIVVLVLGVGVLIAMILLILSMRAGVKKLSDTVDRLVKDTQPLLTNANGIVTDAREVVAMVRTDVERITDAAGVLSEELLNAADVAARRVDDVNALLDVLQEEVENTALSAAATIRGVRVGASELSDGLRHPRKPSAVNAVNAFNDDGDYDDDDY